MPATRAAVRHGSRQPQPYPQDPAGPSNSNPIVLQDDDKPLRKRPTAERKVSKSNPKQKARAPLPPAAEIIEISSDEDEPPPRKKTATSSSASEKKIKELQEENKSLMAALAAAKAAHAQALAALPAAPLPPKVQAPPPDAKADKFLSAVEDHVTCEVCTVKMWHPFTLACGHTFCKDCLVDWFNTALIKHLSAHPHYDAQRVVPLQYRNVLAQPNIPTHTRAHYEREIAIIMSTTPQPKYSCPTCRVLVKAKPAENFVVKHLVRTIAGVQGESCPQEAPLPRHPGQPVEGPFDGFFPYA
ncbi:hypothetical protein L226DRAFT_610241 [Lentinus tigrinus ALCF2SS1-7]|uniref:uncharacterized protein n=1 Tax=Lentinus tigrinus ALCF2SS1-7 TaxID=1328758 RepID=UPI0011662092|nr:hypothetical protein L226DRAFT_610241 [Lentinus tigrinus ALCF2SS1-7]